MESSSDAERSRKFCILGGIAGDEWDIDDGESTRYALEGDTPGEWWP